MSSSRQSKLAEQIALTAALLLSWLGCSQTHPDAFMGNTNWLHECKVDADCETDLCACGVCTRSCQESADCTGLSDARCDAQAGIACKETSGAGAGLCLPECSRDADCGAETSCVEGSCRPEAQRKDGSVESPSEPAVCEALSGGPLLRVFDSDGSLIEEPRAISGTVTETGTGQPDDVDGAKWGFGQDAHWLRIAGQDATWTVMHAGFEQDLGVGPGSRVHATVEQAVSLARFAPPWLRFELLEDDALAFYYELSSAIANLEPPQTIRVGTGQASCSGETACIDFEDRELTISVSGSDDVTLAPGARTRARGADISYLNGRHDIRAHCSDAWEARVELAIGRVDFDLDPSPSVCDGEDCTPAMTRFELQNESSGPIWTQYNGCSVDWLTVHPARPSVLSDDEAQAFDDIIEELGCICDCADLAAGEVCTQDQCPTADGLCPSVIGSESTAPGKSLESSQLLATRGLDSTNKCLTKIGYPSGSDFIASFCWWPDDPLAGTSMQSCKDVTFRYGEPLVTFAVTDASDEDAGVDGAP